MKMSPKALLILIAVVFLAGLLIGGIFYIGFRILRMVIFLVVVLFIYEIIRKIRYSFFKK